MYKLDIFGLRENVCLRSHTVGENKFVPIFSPHDTICIQFTKENPYLSYLNLNNHQY
jgi:hypothetical protein